MDRAIREAAEQLGVSSDFELFQKTVFEIWTGETVNHADPRWMTVLTTVDESVFEKATKKAEHPSLPILFLIRDAFAIKDYAKVRELMETHKHEIPENAYKRAYTRTALETYTGIEAMMAEEGPMRGTALLDGYYTVVLPKGHITFRVWTQKADAKFAAGQTLLGRLRGAENDNASNYQTVAFVANGGERVTVFKRLRDDENLMLAIQILQGDPSAAEKGYALEAKTCYVCNRPLTTPESIESGIGPVCANRRAGN